MPDTAPIQSLELAWHMPFQGGVCNQRSLRCRFEGYEEAIASATACSAATWAGSAEAALQQTMSSLRGMLSPRSATAPLLATEAPLPGGAAVAESTVLTPRSVSSFLGLLRPRLEETSTDSNAEQVSFEKQS